MLLVTYCPSVCIWGGGKEGEDGKERAAARGASYAMVWLGAALGQSQRFPHGYYTGGFCAVAFNVVANLMRPRDKTQEMLRETEFVTLTAHHAGHVGKQRGGQEAGSRGEGRA